MKYTAQDILIGALKTIFLLIFLEIFSSAILPAFGIINFKPAFNVLIVLFLAFKFDHPSLPFLILIIQYVHAMFSIEGWASGTFTGIVISMSLRYVKDMLNFSTPISTIVVVQVFQIAWFILIAFLLSIKIGDFSGFLGLFLKHIPESIVLSLFSPLFFRLLNGFWKVGRVSNGARM